MRKATLATLCAAATLMGSVPAFAADTVGAQDVAFADNAAQGGRAEVWDAKLALTKARDAKIVVFANKMIEDHGKVNVKLAQIASIKHLRLSGGVGPKNAQLHSALMPLQGAAFDKAYLQQQKVAHTETITLLETEIATGHDPSLVSFAKKTLPKVKEHLDLLEDDIAVIGK